MGDLDDERGSRDGGGHLTAYPDEEADLRRRFAGGRVDGESFRRSLARCEISTCQGMCCYDGVYVSRESADVIRPVAEKHATFFAGLGLRLPEAVIVEGDWRWKKGGLKTAVAPRALSSELCRPGFSRCCAGLWSCRY